MGIEHGVFLRRWAYDSLVSETLSPRSRFTLAVDAGTVEGYAITRCYSDWAELMCVAVAESARGRGIGALLLADAEARAAESGAERLLLEVHSDNAPAAALYARRGFCAVGRRRGYYPDPPGDAILMEKNLAAGGGGAGEIGRRA
jgi:ribosomal-protein-alanine N-acetyltransferase